MQSAGAMLRLLTKLSGDRVALIPSGEQAEATPTRSVPQHADGWNALWWWFASGS